MPSIETFHLNFIDRLKSLVERHPTAVAVTDHTSDQTISYTFSEMADRVYKLKNQIEKITSAGEGVAFLLETGAESVCAFWAAVCAERCYIPLHLDMAIERLQAVLDDTKPAVILGDRASRDELTKILSRFGYREETWDDADPVVFYRRDDARKFTGFPQPVAAIVHTSGSTGIPKGIVHSRTSLHSSIAAFRDLFGAGPGDRVFTTVPHHFDVAIFDIFSFVMTGAEIIIPNSSLFERPRALCEFLHKEGITFLHAVPTTNRLILNYGKPERFEYSKVRHVITGGEVLTSDTAMKLQKAFSSAVLHNLYGPAEIICCTYFSLPKDFFEAPRDSVPIGRIFGKNEFKIAEDGELLVTGEQLMLEYWNRPDLTDEKISLIDGKRWYATGDIVRENEEGLLEYRGRRDRMVKRRGIRIELDDIQGNMTKVAGVIEAAVVAKPDAVQGCRIIAHVCLKEGFTRDALSLKEDCRFILPSDMVPDRIEIQEKFPRTSTGKVDYQSLVSLS